MLWGYALILARKMMAPPVRKPCPKSQNQTLMLTEARITGRNHTSTLFCSDAYAEVLNPPHLILIFAF
jgi:hypothetical protein